MWMIATAAKRHWNKQGQTRLIRDWLVVLTESHHVDYDHQNNYQRS